MNRKRTNFTLLFLSIFILLTGCTNSAQNVQTVNTSNATLRGVWVQAKSLRTQTETDAMLARVEKGNFNTVFINVVAYGHSYYDSDLLTKAPKVTEDYNPLAYFIDQAHKRNIAVHAWVVTGGFGAGKGKYSPVLGENPDWTMIGPDGQTSTWLNYNREDVRDFIGNMVLDIINNYDVDGVHFDYLRYPDADWTFDPHTSQSFTNKNNIDLDILRYPDLPAYGEFKGNALGGVVTAQTLAMFDNGTPALLINQHGEGTVITFNWDATKRQIAAASNIIKRSIDHFSDAETRLLLLKSETNGSMGLEKTQDWFDDLGYAPLVIAENTIPDIPSNSILVMPNIYTISSDVAANLSKFVQAGGKVIFIDGPTLSIGNKDIQAITGMRTIEGHFQEVGFLVPIAKHPILPISDLQFDKLDYQELEEKWRIYRSENINALLQDVYQKAKVADPDVTISITVNASHEKLQTGHFLDWQDWLEEEYIDIIIPRAYVDEGEQLPSTISPWEPNLNDNSDRIVLGLIDYKGRSKPVLQKSPEQMLIEIQTALDNNSPGYVIFDLDSLSDEILNELAKIDTNGL